MKKVILLASVIFSLTGCLSTTPEQDRVDQLHREERQLNCVMDFGDQTHCDN